MSDIQSAPFKGAAASPTSVPALEAPPAPAAAIAPDGRPCLGAFRGTLRSVGLERWASLWQRHARQKQWQYVAVLGADIIAGAAVVDVGYTGLAFVLAWERESRRWFEAEVMTPLALGVSIDGGPDSGRLGMRFRGQEVTHTNVGGAHRVTARMTAGSKEVSLDWQLGPQGPSVERLSCVSRLSGGGINVTQKAVGVPISGRIAIDGREHLISPDRHVALVDWTCGYPAYSTAWRWAMGAGRQPDGRIVGFNLCVGYNDTDHTENAVWVDGKLHRVGRVLFSIPPEPPPAPWHIRGEDGALELTFVPEAVRAADENYLIVASRYRQPVGRYSGAIPDGRGGTLHLENLPGLAEEHQARW